jgi:hypothetical protein
VRKALWIVPPATAAVLIFGSVRHIHVANEPRFGSCSPPCVLTVRADRMSNRTHVLIAAGEAALAALILAGTGVAVRRRRLRADSS